MSLSARYNISLNTPRDGDATSSLGNQLQCLNAFFWEEISPNFQPETPLAQLEAIHSSPSTSYL